MSCRLPLTRQPICPLLQPAICLKWGASVFVNGMFALRFLIKRLYDDETKKRDELDTHSGRKKKK